MLLSHFTLIINDFLDALDCDRSSAKIIISMKAARILSTGSTGCRVHKVIHQSISSYFYV